MKLAALFLFSICSVSLLSQRFYSESQLKEHWKVNGMESTEGIYEAAIRYTDRQIPCPFNGQIICYYTWRTYSPQYKVALVKISGEYKLIYLSSIDRGSEKVSGCRCDGKSYIGPERHQWRIGDVKANLNRTATQGFFKCDWFMLDKSRNTEVYLVFESSAYFTVIFSDDREKTTFYKMYPTAEDVARENKQGVSSGTGFALSSNGVIVTNYHVIDGANSIAIRGVGADFAKKYKAKVLVTDKTNDLALIQIDDEEFRPIPTIPYTIATGLAAVGESIFTLGYPLRATMGDEIKLTNGVVSSRTGFQGDVTSYQVSAPVQPGNSGGPVFDSNGNLIGIINAKHMGAENASYAIKSGFLMNLVDLLPSPIKLQTINSLTGKSLSQQVQLVQRFVYIVETH